MIEGRLPKLSASIPIIKWPRRLPKKGELFAISPRA